MKPPLPSPSTRTPQPSPGTSQTAPRTALPPTVGRHPSGSRPPLQRQSPSTLSGRDDDDTPRPQTLPNADSSASTDDSSAESDISSAAEEGMEEERNTHDGAGDATSRQPAPSTEEARLQKLREAVNAKMLLAQQQARFGSINMAASSGSLGARRVSPIKEEGSSTVSPSLDASFSSPIPTGAQSASTESTESQRTVRGSVPATPAQMPVRTPSYPFPYIPGTPRTWSSSFHQPFTALSPTIDALHTRDTATPRERTLSGTSTPAGSGATFMPAGSQSGPEDPRYPSPNLYELVLLLNSEPGLDAWWNIVVKVMHESYSAQRVTLAVPADAADIENVPWGQKATFNAAARGELWPPDDPSEDQMPDAPRFDSAQSSLRKVEDEEPLPAAFSSVRNRPKLVSRHSFAGHERQRRDLSTEYDGSAALPSRPRGPLRTVSHAPNATPRTEFGPRPAAPAQMDPSPLSRQSKLKESTFSDPDFSSFAGDVVTGPYAAVFPVLRALDHEADALIDTTGINRILERGKLVTLTRDYSSPAPSHRRSSDISSGSDTIETPTSRPARAQGHPTLTESRASQPTRDIRNRLGNLVSSTNAEGGNRRLSTHYEEYEQFPSSPWAQSPAPSPAIQADPEDNPFFATTNVDEDSFNPTETAQDYSRADPVEAIGVDSASTLTHLPLFHPSLSQPMQPNSQDSPSVTPGVRRSAQEERRSDATATSERAYFQRRAPIAILSLLSATVPYPQSLTQSLKMLGPHLATSFSNAYAYSTALRQLTGIRVRRNISGLQGGSETVTSETATLDNLMHLDIDDIASSVAGSITSPSDYSGRSRHSPGGSIAGTPGWDPGAIGFSTKLPVGNTPSHLPGVEVIDSYFDAKKGQTGYKPTSSIASALQQGQQGGRSSPTVEYRGPPRQVTIAERDDVITSKTEQKPRSRVREDKTGLSVHTAREKSPNRQTEVTSPLRPAIRTSLQADQTDRRHSLLHSYGADFSSTFQSLPAATTPGLRTPGPLHTHGRSGSGLDTFDMPPPSERLLRTIIDSLPVQIFTAKPDTGELTWVNSKFLVYRGQDSRQAIQDPWRAIHPEDREEYMSAWHKSLKTGQQLQAKVRLQRFDGHYRWFYVRAAPLKDKRQSIRHWIGTNMDMHEQHIAEQNSARQQETAASEAKYRALANSSPQIVFAVTKSKGVIFCNSQWLTYSGQTEEQALGLGFMDYVHPEDLSKCRLPAFNEDGTAPVNVPTSLPPDLRRSQSSSSSGGSSETSRTVTSPGPGNSPPSAMELPQAKLSALASTGILKVSRDADGRPSYSTEVRLRSKDGNYRWHLVRILLAEPVHQESGEEETWYGTCTDINDHKLLEQTLKETMDAKSRFLSNMSHEIRTPLNGITGMVNFLMDGNLNSEQMEHVNVIRSSAEGLRDLINDILDLSKVEAGMITLQWDWLHIRSLIEEVNDLTSSLAINKRLELNYIVDEDVPSMVKGDRFRIRQVLLNVIGNAIKFTKQGEVFVHCKMARERGKQLSEHQAMIQFEVIDTGSGFTEKQAEYLFKRFSQIDGSSTRQHGGTGLGLAISMQLVELHGGQMKASSVPGKGSTFTFTIKFGLPHEGDQPPPPPVTPGIEPQFTVPAPSVPSQRVASAPAQALQFATQQALRRSRISDPPAPLVASPTTVFGSPSPSSASSDPSIRTATTSIRSERSSASSYVSEPSFSPAAPVTLSPPPETRASRTESPAPSRRTANIAAALAPLMYSILVVCPFTYSREATVKHIEMTLPKTIPHQITAREDLNECRHMIGGEDPVIFTHIVLVLQEVSDIVPFMDQILRSPAQSSTSLVVISDLMQKREIVEAAPQYDYEQLQKDGRLLFIFKPLKPSRIATIFDPQKERELSTDRAQDSAQQVAVTQKQVFEEMKRRLGHKHVRVLLVEDNQINQTVILKFLGKIDATIKTVTDGIQCTDEVFSHPHDLYSIILCDLHMPNKDGYQTCKEIRRWERKNKYNYLPIIALSANVLGDVYAKCAEAGFNSYVTKPIDFKVFSRVLIDFLDPEDPSKPHEFMRPRRD